MKPTFAVKFGSSVCVFFTPYHAAQLLRALTLNGTPAVTEVLS